MKDNNKTDGKSRRWFLSLLTQTDKKKDRVKMLTAEGKLVEIDRAVLEAVSKKQRSSNSEIYEWMKNPSKDNNS